MNGLKMYHHNKEVFPVPIKTGLTNFLNFLNLNKRGVCVVTGHNIISYDVPVLVNAFRNCCLVNLFLENVQGICDTLPVFKVTNPGLTSYSQVNLYNQVIGESYQAHDSLQDAMALKRLLVHLNPDVNTKLCHTYSLESAIKRIEYSEMGTNLMSTLVPLVDSKSISKGIAHKIAFSGLSFIHIKLAFDTNGRQGVEDVLTEDFQGKARVTRSRKILDSLCDFLERFCASEV